MDRPVTSVSKPCNCADPFSFPGSGHHRWRLSRRAGGSSVSPSSPIAEETPMIVEIRTYTLQPGTVPQFEERLRRRCRPARRCRRSPRSGTPRSGR